MLYMKNQVDQSRKFFCSFWNKEMTGGVSRDVIYIVGHKIGKNKETGVSSWNELGLRVDSEIVLNQLDTVRPCCLSTKTFSRETAYPLNETLYYGVCVLFVDLFQDDLRWLFRPHQVNHGGVQKTPRQVCLYKSHTTE